VYLLENNAWLPLGFLANNQIINMNFASNEKTFVFQNKLFRAATGLNEDVWKSESGQNLVITGANVEVKPQPLSGYCYYTADASGGRIIYRYTAERDGLFCIDLLLPKKNKISVWKNGVELFNETYSVPQSMAVSQVNKGDIIEVYLTCAGNTKSYTSVRAATLDETVFRKGYDILAASTLQLTTFKNTKVEGTITCNRDGVLYTSIPQDGNWTATVDGQPAQIALIGDAMVGLLLTEGEHTITFTYKNEAFSLGAKITVVCACILFFLYLKFYKPRENNKKAAEQKPLATERGIENDTTVTEDPGSISDPENE
jgi:hypothetical protein